MNEWLKSLYWHGIRQPDCKCWFVQDWLKQLTRQAAKEKNV
jgi:hypothetical protein